MEYFSKSFHKAFRRLFFPSGFIVSFYVRGGNIKRFLSDTEDQCPISDKYVSDYKVNLKKNPLNILSGFSQDKQNIFPAVLNNSMKTRVFPREAAKHTTLPRYRGTPKDKLKDAWGWCMGMIQRDDIGWEVGGGFMFGNSCTPVVDSCQCMAKPIQYCKIK